MILVTININMSLRNLLLEIFDLKETILDKNVLKAILLSGGPGSGKSTVISYLSQHIHPLPKVIDSDKLFEIKLNKSNITTKLAPEGTPLRKNQMAIRNSAINAIITMLNSHLNGYLPVILDGTGKDYAKHMEKKKVLESLGYDVMCLIVNTTLETSLHRNRLRIRSLPDEQVTEFWNICQENFKRYVIDFKYHYVFNNDKPIDDPKFIKHINEFLKAPVENPIGQELLKNKHQGPVVRTVAPELIKNF